MSVHQSDINTKIHYYQLLIEHFNETELRTLCFKLDIEYADLPSEGRAGKARELISYVSRRNRLDELVTLGKQERPNAAWELEAKVSKETATVSREVPSDLSHGMLSDRLDSDHALSNRFQQVKEQWYKMSKLFVIPELGKSWVEYCESLDRTAGKIVPQDWGSEDIFVLCCAILLHRVGLIPNNSREPAHTYKSYALYSKDYILNLRDLFKLDKARASDIAWVCYGHRDCIVGDNDKQFTLIHDELESETKKGRKQRKEIASYLRILSRLGTMGADVPEICAKLYFGDTSTPDYRELKMNSLVSGFTIIPSDVSRWKIALNVKLPECVDLITNLRSLKELENTLKDELVNCSRCLGHPDNSFFFNPAASLDTKSLSEELKKCAASQTFQEALGSSLESSLRCLLSSRNPDRNQLVKGWGPFFRIERGGFENYKSARVANTSEALLALTGWPLISESVDQDMNSLIVEAISEAVKSFTFARINSVPGRKEDLETKLRALQEKLSQAEENARTQIKDSIKELETTKQLENTFNPLTSLTYKVPTLRVNSLAVFAFAHLLDETVFSYTEGIEDEILALMKDCIHWICKTNTGPFATGVATNLMLETLFQLIMAFKALICSQKHWRRLKLTSELSTLFETKVAEFVHSFEEQHRRNETWPKLPLKAMMLEVLAFYIEKDASAFTRKVQIRRLVGSLVDELLDAVKVEKFHTWEDMVEILRDEGMENPKDWTHVTGAWAVEGLCKCKLANLLTKPQETRLLQILPLVLLRQDSDGFFDSSREQDNIKKTIFTTALYTYALTQAYKAIKL